LSNADVSIDVVMLTLDAENFLEKCLYSIYQEVPVRKLFVCDGGSKDETINLLKKFPRIELHLRPDIRTMGKGLEFLISLVKTKWFLFIDGDIELADGWFDEMSKYQNKYDVIENSNRILAYHMYREDKRKLELNVRALDNCHLIRKDTMQNFHCDDDYMSRFIEIFVRQFTEKSGFKYGKVSSTRHIHHETERIPYESDSEKNFQKIEWSVPKKITIDEKKEELYKISLAKAVVKYLDPNYELLKSKSFDQVISILERKWIIENGPVWLERYDAFIHSESKS